jgi:hypothetical protein
VPSQIFFPLRSNAAALMAGPGVAGIRRRILAAALLHDEVVLEDGLCLSWSGPAGGAHMMNRGPIGDVRWQTPRRRGAATGATHYVSMKSSTSPANSPAHAMIYTQAEFSWQATYEPFRRELPASASTWLNFGHPTDDTPIKAMVSKWQSEDRQAAAIARLRGQALGAGGFSSEAVLAAGYYDLATSAIAQAAVSVDRRHADALRARLALEAAHRIRAAHALEVLLPTGFRWDDVPVLRKSRGIRDYRVILGEIEEAALAGATSIEDLERRIASEYAVALSKAQARGLSFGGRVILAAVGFVAGVGADVAAPIVGGAAIAVASFAAGEVLDLAAAPRWLTVDRTLRKLESRVSRE